jgi:hypothetical protein
MVEIENRSKQLQRYYDKRIEINEKNKKYFRLRYYPQNRNKLTDYQRVIRQMGGKYPRNKLNYLIVDNPNYRISEPLVIQRNIRVSF